MSLLVSWLLFPLLLAALSFGCGLLVEAAAGTRLPFALLLPVGFSLIVCVAALATMSGTTAELAAPAVVACAVAGVAWSPQRVRFRMWPFVAAGATYAAYAAPTVLSGRATFDGYIKLDDTATYLAMLDRVMTHGRSLAGLSPSTYEATLSTSLDYGYPVGSFVPLGVGHQLLGTDAAWLWQPYLTFLAALLALALYALAAPLVASRPLRAGVAFLAAQPALLFGYALWGGIKELSAAALLAAGAALVPVAARDGVRTPLPLAVVAAALLGILSIGGAAWLGPLLAGAAVVVALARGVRRALPAAAVFAGVALLLSIPPIVAAVEWLPRSRGFTSESELGNLSGPLDWLQVFGIWPVGDFRETPDLTVTRILVAVVASAAVAGAVLAARRRSWALVTYAATVAVGAFAISVVGSPWVGAKALATAAPAALLFAFVALAVVAARGLRIEAGLVALALAAGVLWSNVLAYRDVWLAPRARLAELEHIGKQFAGRGPALMTEYEPYGARHFLRNLDAEGASELRRSLIPLRSGQPVPPQGFADIDRFDLGAVLAYRLLVLRRSPVASTPPAAYARVWSGRYYDVWQRRDDVRVLAHLPLGNGRRAAQPRCSDVLALSRTPDVHRVLASVPPRDSSEESVWVGGSFLGRIDVTLNGDVIGSARHELEWPETYVELARARAHLGRSEIAVAYTGGGWRPGSSGTPPFPYGPLVVTPDGPSREVSVEPARARSLCGGSFDWIEAVG